MSTSGDMLLQVAGLRTHFPLRDGTVKAVDGVSFSLDRQVTVGLVGESGCGKSIMAQSILQIQSWPGEIVAGSVNYYGNGGQLDLAAQSPKSKQLRQVRGKGIAYIHQEPMAALSLLHTVGSQILEAIHVHDPGIKKEEAADIAVEMLERVGIPNARGRLDDYIFNFSGGMRQRVMIAMALVNRPQLLIADEPTTAVDVTIQAQILELLNELKEQLAMSVMIITHDLGVVRHFSDRSGVMYLGKIVEMAPTRKLFSRPRHPYTAALLAASPVSHPRLRGKRNRISGDVPDPANRPSRCPFHPRCKFAKDICKEKEPILIQRPSSPDHTVACHFSEKLDLQGVEG